VIDDDIAPLVERDPSDTRSDRQRISAAFTKLRKLGYAAYMSVKEEAPEATTEHGTVFWYAAQDERAFGSGELRSANLSTTLWLHWRSTTLYEIVETLEAEGLRVLVSAEINGPLAILPMPSNRHAFMPKPGAIEAGDYKRGCYVCGGQHDERKRRVTKR
jgi:hypothetical protein